ncbi:unnamed protein product [Cyclocybe aegerita]|uniref:Uncharacterized protein n=1 Tax=Cyclocybe aegerita TaxID=1973307 RepID=A0A8S0W470_CYCAE|nr:unnamed protein product [Cyclocybe aegerita]
MYSFSIARFAPSKSAALLVILSNSPVSVSASTSPRPTVNATSDPPRPRQSQPTNPPSSAAQTPKDSVQRDGSKYKFAVGLIDQAVKTLSDLWRPHDIPRVFLAPQKGAAIPTSHSTSISSNVQQQPLAKSTHPSSPDSPSTQPAPPPAPTPVPSQRPPQVLVASDSESDLLPLRSFVHEVLKRSRTSGSVLQTALCYLEAIRPKIAEILRDEKQGIRNLFQPETRILPATEAELAREAEFASLEEASGAVVCSDECMKTVRVMDQDQDEQDATLDVDIQSTSSSLIVEPSIAEGPSSTLPSPLLCPRRAFLASLILASKFSQDKCYSNRAWAKLSGLPPREIGRCERALGQALDWRLWVGKVASASVTPTSTPPIRTVIRTQSESSLSIGSPLASRTPFLVPQEPIAPAPVAQQQQDPLSAPTSVPVPVPTPLGGASNKRLRKSTTLPADAFAFAASCQAPTSSAVAPALDSGVYCDASTSATSLSAYQIGSNDMDIVDDVDVFDARKQDLQASPFFRFPPFCTTRQILTALLLPRPKTSTPSPDTPLLTYSPSSTDSAGDRTVQMTSFEDGTFPACPSSQSWLDVTLAASATSSSCSSSTLAPEQHYGLLGAPSVRTASPTPMTTPLPFVVAHRNHKAKQKAYLSRAASGVAFDLAMAARRAAEGVGDPMITVVTDAEAVPPFGSSRMGHYLWHADSGIAIEPTGVH